MNLRTSIRAAVLAAALGVSAGPMPAHGARMTIWDLKLGTHVDAMPAWIEFKGYACGSNGGPVLTPLKGWQEFQRCRPDDKGLYEVYFEYDDEEEYIARALEDGRLARNAGTVDKQFPVVTSALFDAEGVLQGIRLITDPRPDYKIDNFLTFLKPREEHHLYGAFVTAQFGIVANRDCKRLELGPGETDVGGQFTKLDCERVDAAQGRRYVVQVRYYRKPGQYERDPNNGLLTEGQFESWTRAEVFLLKP
ncbi:MAG: hypothetical protein FJX64_06720 [Alphaproteobacteria bacterium]|nr:hypothetical protein [Alphaproteobacteria bacterium]